MKDAFNLTLYSNAQFQCCTTMRKNTINEQDSTSKVQEFLLV
jgi:hypothetical protein